METRKEELEVLLEFSRIASTAVTVSDLVQAMRVTVTEGFGYDRVTVYVSDPENDRRMREAGGAAETSDSYTSWSLDEEPDLAGLLSGEQVCVWSSDISHIPHHPLEGCNPPAPCVILALKNPQKLIGLIVIDNSISGRPITEKEGRALQSFARQAAANLQNVTLVEDLRKSEERLHTLVTSLSETLYSVRIARGSIIPSFYSPQIKTLTGYSPEEAVNTPQFWRTLMHPDDRPKLERIKEALLNGRSAAYEYRILHKSGEIRWVLDTPVPVTGSDDGAMRVNGSILDITDRKLLEDRLRRAQRMETAGTLAAGVAHNFNNYLQIIIFQVDEAKFYLPADHQSAIMLAKTQETLGLASTLAGQLMRFGRKSEGVRSEISLDQLISQTLPLVIPSLGKDVTLDYRPDPDVALVSADTSNIQQALINLCINARDAMKEGGVLTLRAQNVRVQDSDRNRPPHAAPGDYVRLQVHDTGSGMDVETQERVFEPFFTTKPVGQGTGLGLAVTYTIVAEHGGWIEVESKPGRGTLFNVYLPSIHATPPVEENVLPTQRIVLVVDSDERERESLARLLESMGVDVLTAEGVSDAMAVIWDAGERLDAVLCSLELEFVDVAQLYKVMKEERTPATLILTADKTRAREWSRSGRILDTVIVQKPYDKVHLADVLGIDRPTSISTDRIAESVPSS